MKKHMKVMAALSTTALMAVFAPALAMGTGAATAYAAASGWVQEDGGWVYYDSDGYRLTDTWKKDGDSWYYLDSDGMRASSMQVDEYYVGEDGKRVANTWVSIENEDYSYGDEEPEIYWYYYGRDGKMSASRWVKIDGYSYYFNEDGHMMTGSVEIDGANYYLGEEGDGKMKTGWILLEDETDDPDVTESWFYYDRNGQRVENQVDKKIDGAYYTFEDGRMVTGWYKLPEVAAEAASESAASEAAVSGEAASGDVVSEGGVSESAASQAPASSEASHEDTAAGYQYYDEDGKRASGWRTIQGIEGLSDEDETYRFYFKNGEPYHAESGLELFTIDSKRYAFNTKGEMQTGRQSISDEDGTAANYYFGEDGIMRTGKQVIEDEDSGEHQNWYFRTDGANKGQGYHGIKDNVLYIQGLRQEADRDLRYAPVELDGVSYLINVNGSVQKASSSSKSSERADLGAGYKDFEDEDGNIWVVDTQGRIQK